MILLKHFCRENRLQYHIVRKKQNKKKGGTPVYNIITILMFTKSEAKFMFAN